MLGHIDCFSFDDPFSDERKHVRHHKGQMKHNTEHPRADNVTEKYHLALPGVLHFLGEMKRSPVGTVATRLCPSTEPDIAGLAGFGFSCRES